MDQTIRHAQGCCSSLVSNQIKEEQSPVKKPRVEKFDSILSEKGEEVPDNNPTDDDINEFIARVNFSEQQRADYIEHVRKTEGWVLKFDDSDLEEDSSEEDPFEEDRARYMEQICQSEGYDVDDFPELDDFGVIAPLLDFKEDLEWLNVSKRCSTLAIEKYNKKKNASYEFVNVEKINIQAVKGFNCWITFLAKDLDDPNPTAEPKTFQAKVYYGIREVIVDECRLKESS